MTNVTVRPFQGDEMLEVMHWLTGYAFEASPPLPDKAEWKELVGPRKGLTALGAFEKETPVGCVAATAMTQNVRGALFDAGGVWGVATHPAARRKGHCRRLMADLLAGLRQDGQALSCLYPFRESFYERLGYVSLPQVHTARFTPAPLLPLLKRDLGGQVELMLISEGFDRYREYLHQMQRRIHGMALFNEVPRNVAQRGSFWLALAKAEGEPEGLMLYDLRGEKEGEFNLRAFRFYYHTSRGRYLLLEWIARHMDQANRVEVRLPPFERPEAWLADLNVAVESDMSVPMVRILDVARLGGMAAGTGCFSARIADPLCPWNEGDWRFESAAGVLQVSAADRADCELTIQGLAALAYGTHDPDDFPVRGWGNPTPPVQQAMRAMFPRMLPHLHEMF